MCMHQTRSSGLFWVFALIAVGTTRILSHLFGCSHRRTTTPIWEPCHKRSSRWQSYCDVTRIPRAMHAGKGESIRDQIHGESLRRQNQLHIYGLDSKHCAQGQYSWSRSVWLWSRSEWLVQAQYDCGQGQNDYVQGQYDCGQGQNDWGQGHYDCAEGQYGCGQGRCNSG